MEVSVGRIVGAANECLDETELVEEATTNLWNRNTQVVYDAADAPEGGEAGGTAFEKFSTSRPDLRKLIFYEIVKRFSSFRGAAEKTKSLGLNISIGAEETTFDDRRRFRGCFGFRWRRNEFTQQLSVTPSTL